MGSDGESRAAVTRRVDAALGAMSPFLRLLQDSAWSRREPDHPDNCDFVFGNPHEFPLPGFVGALERNIRPRNENWFAYKTSEPESQRIIATSLREQRNLPFEPDDIVLTNGAFAALSVSLCALVDPGDEVIYISPPWFFYEPMIVGYEGVPVRVRIDQETLDLDLEAIAGAVSERTKAIIINSPHNPTGKIYSRETLERLSRLLTDASNRYGRPIYLLSDESYSRIVFDGRDFPSPTGFYPWSLLIYTYGKTLLTPGQRIGYIALPPALPVRARLRNALLAAQLITGFSFPNALLQHSLGELEGLSIDIAHLQAKRDRMVTELKGMGYELTIPEGTFYLMVRSPVADDLAFAEVLAEHRIYVLPGSITEMPGWFRLSLTANDRMLERSLPGFASAIEAVGASV